MSDMGAWYAWAPGANKPRFEVEWTDPKGYVWRETFADKARAERRAARLLDRDPGSIVEVYEL